MKYFHHSAISAILFGFLFRFEYFQTFDTQFLSEFVPLKNGQVFNIRPGYELVSVKLKWNIQVPFLQTNGNGKMWESILFSPQQTPNSKWKLQVCDGSHFLRIYACHYNSTGGSVNFVEPVLVKLSITNNSIKKVFQQMVSSAKPLIMWNSSYL